MGTIRCPQGHSLKEQHTRKVGKKLDSGQRNCYQCPCEKRFKLTTKDTGRKKVIVGEWGGGGGVATAKGWEEKAETEACRSPALATSNEWPAHQATHPMGFSVLKTLMMHWAAVRDMLLRESQVLEPMWGVMTQLGKPTSGWSFGKGSGSVTSSPAALMTLFLRAVHKSSWLITPPLPELTMTAVFFILVRGRYHRKCVY